MPLTGKESTIYQKAIQHFMPIQYPDMDDVANWVKEQANESLNETQKQNVINYLRVAFTGEKYLHFHNI
jgi:ferritin